MDHYEMVEAFAARYADNMRNAFTNDDWDERHAIRKEAEWTIREIRNVVKAIDILNRYNIKVG